MKAKLSSEDVRKIAISESNKRVSQQQLIQQIIQQQIQQQIQMEMMHPYM